MTLRRRALFASAGGLGVILLGFIFAISTFISVSSSQSEINGLLTPATQMTDSLLLAQAAASGDLADYVLTGDEAALASHQSAISTTNVMITNLLDTFGEEDPALVALVRNQPRPKEPGSVKTLNQHWWQWLMVSSRKQVASPTRKKH